MINFEYISKVIVIKIGHFVNCLVQNNLQVLMNFVKICTWSTYKICAYVSLINWNNYRTILKAIRNSY